jgi:hypothetical protein
MARFARCGSVLSACKIEIVAKGVAMRTLRERLEEELHCDFCVWPSKCDRYNSCSVAAWDLLDIQAMAIKTYQGRLERAAAEYLALPESKRGRDAIKEIAQRKMLTIGEVEQAVSYAMAVQYLTKS